MIFTRRKLILIALCIVLGAVVTYAETTYVRSVYAEIEEVPVVYAKKDIKLNTPFTSENVEYRQFPKNLMSKTMVTKAEDLKGMVASKDIEAGRPIFLDDLMKHKKPVLEEGYKLVTFTTTLENSLAGNIHIGEYVDIGFVPKQGLFDPLKTPSYLLEKYKAQTLFKKVQIFYITDKEGNNLDIENKKEKENKFAKNPLPATITVALKPDDIVKLKDFEQKGSLFVIGLKTK